MALFKIAHLFRRLRPLEMVLAQQVFHKSLPPINTIGITDGLGKDGSIWTRGVVVREGRGRPHREFTYKLVRPDRAAKAIGETGGALSRGPKREKNRDSGFHHEV
jgi:hypothetical protein